jgi:hypothetical protein
LDGARVLWWAWSGDMPFGKLSGADVDDCEVFGFAICQYETGKLYRFTCNRYWQVMQDMDHLDEDEAKAEIPIQYDLSRISWQRYSEH